MVRTTTQKKMIHPIDPGRNDKRVNSPLFVRTQSMGAPGAPHASIPHCRKRANDLPAKIREVVKNGCWR